MWVEFRDDKGAEDAIGSHVGYHEFCNWGDRVEMCDPKA